MNAGIIIVRAQENLLIFPGFNYGLSVGKKSMVIYRSIRPGHQGLGSTMRSAMRRTAEKTFVQCLDGSNMVLVEGKDARCLVASLVNFLVF